MDLLLAHFPGACVHGEEYVLEYALLTVTFKLLSCAPRSQSCATNINAQQIFQRLRPFWRFA
jgi:hypothetical protein